LYGQSLLVDFNILQGKIASRLVNNNCNCSEDAGCSSSRCRPAEPGAVFESRCDPEIEINAEPATEGNSQARQGKLHCQAVAPRAGYNRGQNFDGSCGNDTTFLPGRDDAGRGWLDPRVRLLRRLNDQDPWPQSFIRPNSAVPIGHRN
jgi:hypothetical protein